MLVGSFVLYNGGWSKVVRSPFPFELTRMVYATNYVDVEVPHYVYVQRAVEAPKPYLVITNEAHIKPIFMTNLYVTNLFTSFITNLPVR